MRTPFIAGNWKMHKTAAEAVDLAEALRHRLERASGVEVAVAPPFTALHAVASVLAGTGLRLAAQNMHFEEQGAFTGEVSAGMLRDAGCSHVILGHSERRQLFGETDASVARKAARALAAGLTPIVCVGESLDEREAGRAFEIVEKQVHDSLAPLGPQAVDRLLVAYEPVWAIGTGRTATASQAQEVHARVRSVLSTLGGEERARRTRILYGGSVKPANIADLMGEPDIDGALVGGASLEAETFASIVGFRV